MASRKQSDPSPQPAVRKAMLFKGARLREFGVNLMMHDIYGKGYPRWRAEQVIPTVEEIESTERLQDARENLRKDLQREGHLGDAYRALVKAGVDSTWLESSILDLVLYPKHRPRKAQSLKNRRKLERIINQLERGGRDLRRLKSLWYFSAVEEWPVNKDDIPVVVGGIGFCLRQALKYPSNEFKESRGWASIVQIVQEIRRQTGRPHFPELTALLSAVFDDPGFSEDQLKMAVQRSRARQRGNTGKQK